MGHARMEHARTRRAITLCITTSLLGLTGCMGRGLLIQPVSTNLELRETKLMSESPWAWNKIAVIDVTGVIMNRHESQLFGKGEHPVSLLLEQLDKARYDDRVKAVVLRINSPGGGTVATDLMYQEIQHFRQTTGKPIVAVLMDVAASGGYYIACGCDEIVAQPASVVGSIGVIFQTFEVAGTLSKIGVTTDAIVSGSRKDSGSPLRPLRPEERETFQQIVNEMYDRFVHVVDEGRPELDEDAVRKLADGRVYTAGQALENGMIDRIATMREVLASIKARIGAERVKVVSYRRPTGYRPNYYSQTDVDPIGEVNMLKLDISHLGGSMTPGFMYLWKPGL